MSDTDQKPLVPGDVVRLKSGGPPMTIVVIDIGHNKLVRCQWFTNDACFTDEFHPNGLRQVAALPE